jgi:hypothetical protein
MALIYTHQKSRRKKKSAKQLRLNAERAEYFKSLGIKKVKNADRSYNFDNSILNVPVCTNPIPLSNAVGNGFKRSVDDYKWRKDRVETAATIEEIERKKTRVAPAYNKGAVQYITDGTDPSHLGRKI